jgi:hypothetical protein
MAAVQNTTGVRAKIFDVTYGSQASPADQAAMYSIGRFVTSVGTAGSNPTPAATDPGDVAAVSVGAITHSVEPTTYVILHNTPLNQRATFRYVCSPGAEFLSTATATSGIGAYLNASTTALVEWVTLVWFE